MMMIDDDMHALYATSNLHMDKCDDGGMLRSCTVHTCHEVDKSADDEDGTTSSSNVPYIPNTNIMNIMETPLSELLSGVSHIVNHCLPNEVKQQQSLP